MIPHDTPRIHGPVQLFGRIRQQVKQSSLLGRPLEDHHVAVAVCRHMIHAVGNPNSRLSTHLNRPSYEPCTRHNSSTSSGYRRECYTFGTVPRKLHVFGNPNSRLSTHLNRPSYEPCTRHNSSTSSGYRRECYTFGTVPRKLHVELGVGYASEFVDGDLGGDFLEDQSALVEDKHGVFGDDHIRLADAGDGERALLDELGLAVLAGMLHGYDDLFRSCHEVHRATDPKLLPIGDDPVGNVPLLIYFKCPDDGGVDVAAPYHPEGCGAVHVDAARSLGNTGPAGIDEVMIHLAFRRRTAHAEHPVFGLHVNIGACDVVGHHGWNANAKVDKQSAILGFLVEVARYY